VSAPGRVPTTISWGSKQTVASLAPDYTLRLPRGKLVEGTVVDEAGQPVSNATVAVWYYVQPSPSQTEGHDKIQGFTDVGGVFIASNQTNGSIDLGFQAGKTGYYSTARGHEFNEFKNDDPEKRRPHATLLLKAVGKPIPMYAKRLNANVPVSDKPVGFDLVAGDWIAPFGKGASTDIIFMGHFDKRADGESDYTLTVNFPNPGDGIEQFTVPDAEKGSDLRSPHEAPSDGYQPQWVQTDNRKPGKPVETSRDENRNYFLRVHTVLDERGNVKSALYGKIYGDFMQFRYYLNPTPNDRNIEFDPKQNLLKGLPSFEQVGQP